MSMTSSRPYIARALYEWIVDNGCTPYVLVDANSRGVVVPNDYVKEGQIVLNISPMAVRSLEIGNEALTFAGRFGGEALTVHVPMAGLMAIYARENGQGMVFEAEAASEPEENSGRGADVSEPPRSPKPSKPRKPSLKVVK